MSEPQDSNGTAQARETMENEGAPPSFTAVVMDMNSEEFLHKINYLYLALLRIEKHLGTLPKTFPPE